MIDLSSQYELANNNDSVAQFELAEIFRKGELVEKNLEKYFYWLTKSVENGNLKAKNKLGLVYLIGHKDLVEPDSTKALELLLNAAEGGETRSQVALGTVYLDGQGTIEQDIQKGVDWLVEAAENGDDEAKFLHAFAFKKHPEVITDIDKVLKWLNESAENGFNHAQELLGLWYSTGDQYLEKDLIQGEKWLKKSENNGSADTLRNAANNYAQTTSKTTTPKEKSLLALIFLIGAGVSFIASLISIFGGQFLGAFGLFLLSALLNGIAKYFEK